jgi:hypothetical protein
MQASGWYLAPQVTALLLPLASDILRICAAALSGNSIKVLTKHEYGASPASKTGTSHRSHGVGCRTHGQR